MSPPRRVVRAAVLALGDLGRSPRIQLHARALAEAGCAVDFMGFAGSSTWLTDGTAGVVPRFLDDHRTHRSRILRGLALSVSLSRALASLATPNVVLVQTPPAVPSLWIAARFARQRGARAVFDWHNLGFSLLALRSGGRSISPSLYRRAEKWFAGGAQAHLCVTRALGDELRRDFGVNASVFEDQPSRVFKSVSEEQRRILRRELLGRAQVPFSDRGIVVVSPTSWTADERFELIESAAEKLDGQTGDPVTLIFSGRGELREGFEGRIARRAARRVRIATVWFEGLDYPRLLPGADLGLSLHASSSGLDFPMKILDLLGSGLPVLALKFPGLSPKFAEGRDGFGFASAEQLAALLTRIDQNPSIVRAMPGTTCGLTWEDAWEREARAVILGKPTA